MALHAELTREIREGASGPKIGAFFDLDQTLLAGFSAFAFFRERLLAGQVAPRELSESLAATLSFSLGRTGFSGLVSAATAAYRGLSVEVLEEIGERVFERQLAGAVFPESRALVRAHQERGHTLAIVSSATRYQIEPLARDLEIEHVLCTELEVEDGHFTGNVVRPTCFGEGKRIAAEKLAAQHDLDLRSSWFYTDSSDDLPLLEVVGHPRPINADAKLSRIARGQGWPTRRFHSRGTPGVAEVARTALAISSFGLSSLAGAPALFLNRSRRQAVNISTSVAGDLATAIAGVELAVEGEEHVWSSRPCVFIFNHQSGIDALLIAKLLRRDIVGVAKKELRRGLLGPFFEFGGTVFVDRADNKQAVAALKPAVNVLRRGLSIAIAPEGTRSPTPRLGPFKKGAFHMAMQAGVPLVPIIFRNAIDALPKGGLIVRPATVECVVLPPIPTTDWKRADLDQHIADVRRQFLEVLAAS